MERRPAEEKGSFLFHFNNSNSPRRKKKKNLPFLRFTREVLAGREKEKGKNDIGTSGRRKGTLASRLERWKSAEGKKKGGWQ